MRPDKQNVAWSEIHDARGVAADEQVEEEPPPVSADDREVGMLLLDIATEHQVWWAVLDQRPNSGAHLIL